MVFARVLIPTADYIGITSRISIRKMGNAFRKSCLEAEDGEENIEVDLDSEPGDNDSAYEEPAELDEKEEVYGEGVDPFLELEDLCYAWVLKESQLEGTCPSYAHLECY